MASDMDLVDLEAELGDKAEAFCSKYKVNVEFWSMLSLLRDYQVVLIANDSTSMMRKSKSKVESVKTRWDELGLLCRLLVEIYSLFNDDGIDILFTNRRGLRNVRNANDIRLSETFKKQPCGFAPICNVLNQILKETTNRPRIVIIVTDECPTRKDGGCDVARFKRMLATMDTSKNHVSVVSLTSEHDSMAFLDDVWHNEICNLNVVHDYLCERADIRRSQGCHSSFGYADYAIKIVLGGVAKYFDSLRELRPPQPPPSFTTATHTSNPFLDCCNIL